MNENLSNLPAELDDSALRGVTDELVAKAEALVIADQSGLTYASELLTGIKELHRKVDEHYDDVITDAFQHHRKLLALKRVWTDKLDAIERAIKPKVSRYLEEQDAKRREAERAAQLAKERIEKAAEKAVDRAHDLIDEGKSAAKVLDKAAEKIEAIRAETPIIPEKPIAEGIQLREVWKFQVEHPELVPTQFKAVDEKLIRKYVEFMKHQAVIPGVRIWSEKAVAVTRTKG